MTPALADLSSNSPAVPVAATSSSQSTTSVGGSTVAHLHRKRSTDQPPSSLNNLNQMIERASLQSTLPFSPQSSSLAHRQDGASIPCSSSSCSNNANMSSTATSSSTNSTNANANSLQSLPIISLHAHSAREIRGSSRTARNSLKKKCSNDVVNFAPAAPSKAATSESIILGQQSRENKQVQQEHTSHLAIATTITTAANLSMIGIDSITPNPTAPATTTSYSHRRVSDLVSPSIMSISPTPMLTSSNDRSLKYHRRNQSSISTNHSNTHSSSLNHTYNTTSMRPTRVGDNTKSMISHSPPPTQQSLQSGTTHANAAVSATPIPTGISLASNRSIMNSVFESQSLSSHNVNVEANPFFSKDIFSTMLGQKQTAESPPPCRLSSLSMTHNHLQQQQLQQVQQQQQYQQPHLKTQSIQPPQQQLNNSLTPLTNIGRRKQLQLQQHSNTKMNTMTQNSQQQYHSQKYQNSQFITNSYTPKRNKENEMVTPLRHRSSHRQPLLQPENSIWNQSNLQHLHQQNPLASTAYKKLPSLTNQTQPAEERAAKYASLMQTHNGHQLSSLQQQSFMQSNSPIEQYASKTNTVAASNSLDQEIQKLSLLHQKNSNDLNNYLNIHIDLLNFNTQIKMKRTVLQEKNMQ